MQIQMMKQMFTILIGRGQEDITVEKFMREKLLLPAGFVQKCFSSGQVSVQGGLAQSSHILRPGQKLRLQGDWLTDSGQHHADDAMNEEVPMCSVLYEDDHIFVVNKPANLIVHADGRTDIDCVDKRVKSYFASTGQLARILHIHRLDQGTTGTLLYGKHGLIARALDEELKRNQIKRTYLALTYGAGFARKGVFNGAIGRDRHTNGKYRVSQTGKEAVTKYRKLVEQRVDGKTLSLVACQLETGRTHQIRVHFSHFGAPIVGDVLYGGVKMNPFTMSTNGFGLHAFRLKFYHPYEEAEINVHSPLPATWQQFFHQWEWHLPKHEQIFVD